MYFVSRLSLHKWLLNSIIFFTLVCLSATSLNSVQVGFQKSNYIIDTGVNNQMALHCMQHLVETDAIQASKNAETD